MAKKNSLRDDLEELKSQVAEIKDATVDKEGKPSLPAGSLQRGVEGIAGRAGIADTGAAWNLAKDVGRAFTPAQVEALARAKMRGESYEDAKAKADESRDNLENNRPGLSAVGSMVQGAVVLAASIALYAKLAGGGSAPAAAPAAPAPAAAPKGNLKAMGKLGLVAAIGAAAGSYLMSQNSQAAPQSSSGPAPAPQPASAPVVAAAAAVKAKSASPAPAAKTAAAKPASQQSAKPAQRQQQQRSSQQRRQTSAQQKQRAGSYERTYRTGKKAGITETVFLNGT